MRCSAVRVGVRDSKNATGPRLSVPSGSWTAMLHSLTSR
ncbi:DUF397 domain-containing protein [Kibdelosporangium lantanae]|uniref:DUF397 domain-containing protein n=1 Tax=Kibdelosporangium lantanae TaxID=1497396 RepID=A0ABW3M4L1_9PSEU